MNTQEKSKSEISEKDASYYQHLEEAKIKKEKYWNDYNQHREEIDEILNTQSPGEETIQIEQNEERRSGTMPFNQKLYYPYSETDNFKGKGLKNCISWFVFGRSNSVYTINQSISPELVTSGSIDIDQQMVSINEFFTLEEMQQLQKYLTQHPDFAWSKFAWREIPLPTTKKLYPLSGVPKGKYRYLFPIFKNDDYDLDFMVTGLYWGKFDSLIHKTYVPNTPIYKLYNDDPETPLYPNFYAQKTEEVVAEK